MLSGYLHGCNYPWSTDGHVIYYGLDFGANVWGSHLGVSTRRTAVARDFAEMAALGFTVARWFLFADGRSGIVYDDAGLPAGVDSHLFGDLDAALEIARDHGIRIDFVLLDHRWMFEGVRETIADPVSGALLEARLPEGRARILLTEDGQDALFEHVLNPVVTRYGPAGTRADLASQVLAWEFMNEPDFVVEEWEQDLSSHVPQPLRFAALAVLVGLLSDVVHQRTRALSTLGGARWRNLWAWDDDSLGLDVLQVHLYPDVQHPEWDDNLFGVSWRHLGRQRAVILGEVPGNATEQHPKGVSPAPLSLDDYLEFAVACGYLGAWPWSFSGTDGYGRLPAKPLRRFGMRHPDLVNPRFQP
jgi:hypothetical protein